MAAGYQKILLVTNGSHSAQAAEESALNLAIRDGAEVIIADSLRRQGSVEKMLVRNSDQIYSLLEQEKRDELNSLAERFVERGVERVKSELLIGRSSEEILKLVAEEGCDLVVRYRKGTNSLRRGLLGRTSLNLLRECPCPLLLVKEDCPIESPHVLACVDIHDEGGVNEVIVDAARLLKGKDPRNIGVLYCWFIFGHQMIRRRMSPDHYRELHEEIRGDREKEFDEFLARFDLSRSMEDVCMEFGEAELVVPRFVASHQIDVTVMSTVTPGSLSQRLLGSTIEHVVDELPTNLLAVKPPGFAQTV